MDREKQTGKHQKTTCGLKRQDLNNLLQELTRAGKVIHEGARRSVYWVLREEN